MKTSKDKLIEKMEEYIKYLREHFNIGYLALPPIFESEIATLKAEIEKDKLLALYNKVKEANTPDKRTFEDVEKKLSAEEILDGSGEMKDYFSEADRKYILSAMEEYRQQGMPTDEENPYLLTGDELNRTEKMRKNN